VTFAPLSCPECNVPLVWRDLSRDPFRCPRCENWLCVPKFIWKLPGWIGLVLSFLSGLDLGLSEYRLLLFSVLVSIPVGLLARLALFPFSPPKSQALC